MKKLLVSSAALLASLLSPLAQGQSARASEGYLTTPDGVRLFYRTIGDGHSVVLLPGAIYLYDDFERYGRGRRLIAYDLRNRGRSDAVADAAKLQRGVHQDADDMEAVRRHFGVERIAVIAHSYVGLVAALYAMNHPEHVSRVVQIGPAPPSATTKYASPADAQAMFAQAFAKLGQLQKTLQGDPVALCKRSWEALAPVYVADPRHAASVERWGNCDHENERGALRHFNTNILPTIKTLQLDAALLAKASMPVLTIHGALDRSAPHDGGRDWAAKLPNARLLTIDGAGHAPWIEAPAIVHDAIEVFLRGDWPSTAKRIEPASP